MSDDVVFTEIVIEEGGGGDVIGPLVDPAPGTVAIFGANGRVLAASRAGIDGAGNIVTPGAVVPGGPTPLVVDTLLTSTDNGRRFNNRGATGAIVVTVPPSANVAGGWAMEFAIATAFLVTLQLQGGDVILSDTTLTGAPGFFKSASKGACFRLEFQGANEFFVTRLRGPWDFGPLS